MEATEAQSGSHGLAVAAGMSSMAAEGVDRLAQSLQALDVGVTEGLGDMQHADDVDAAAEEAVKCVEADRFTAQGRHTPSNKENVAADVLSSSIATPETDLLPEREPLSEDEFPSSYKTNSTKELEALEYVRSFVRQYSHLYPQRRPVPLIFKNECDVEKFICSTIRPSPMPYKELGDHSGAASFVADYISYEPLEDPINLPNMLPSPTTTLWRQRGHCLSMAVLLCCMLEGAGYNAGIVVGFATKQVCQNEDRETSRLGADHGGLDIQKPKNASPAAEDVSAQPAATRQPKQNKYALKLGKKLKSRYKDQQSQRDNKSQQDAEGSQPENDAAKDKPSVNKEADDPLYGLRMHCWILVMPGRRAVVEPFFIEPTTGMALSPLDPNYLGIEAVINSRNAWMNMQSCRDGLSSMLYDLQDSARWEPLYEADAIPQSKTVTTLSTDKAPFWIKKLTIDPKDFQTRCPRGKKTEVHGNTKIEIFAHYLNDDGLVRRETVYSDAAMSTALSTSFLYAHRADKLLRRNLRADHEHGGVEEELLYLPGHAYHIRRIVTKMEADDTISWRKTFFYNSPRVDGLIHRLETPTEVVEEYRNRDDYLVYRRGVFQTSVVLQPPEITGDNQTPEGEEKLKPSELFVVLEERYNRNPAVPADRDVAHVTFYDDSISATYQREDGHISATTREFDRPGFDEKQNPIPISRDMVDVYRPDGRGNKERNMDLHSLYEDLRAIERRCRRQLNNTLEETRHVLRQIAESWKEINLEVSIFDTTRNKAARERREAREREERELQMLLEKQRADYISPYLCQLDDPDHLTPDQAAWIHKTCLQDLEAQIQKRAQLTKASLNRERTELQKRQDWYQQARVSLTPEQEEEHIQACHDHLFKIKVLEKKLDALKKTGPQKYAAMDNRLRNDPRLRPLLESA